MPRSLIESEPAQRSLAPSNIGTFERAEPAPALWRLKAESAPVTSRALWRLVLASVAIIAPAQAAIFPAYLGNYAKSAPETVSAPDRALYDEYGIEASESADYTPPGSTTSDKKRFVATGWRFHDSTGAMAMFEARRPPKATPSPVGKLAVTTSDGVIFAYGNYLLQFTGSLPQQPEFGQLLTQVYNNLPLFEQSAMPILLDALPAEGLIPNSERYILGPVSLDHFAPGIAPSIAAFHLGAEGQVGQYQTPKGKLTLAIFDYPTPNMARERYEEFAKIPGAVAKRAGSLIAVTVRPPDPDAAERVLAQVRYEANVTLNEPAPVTAKQVSGMMLGVIALAGAILFICLIAGIGFGVFRVIFRKFGWLTDESTAMITLHLGANK